MAYAHARGVIHRDLKPSNIMVGSFGEVQVMDWGLAKVLDQGGVADEEKAILASGDAAAVWTLRSGSAAMESRPGSVLGTPSYMAPEQARGELDTLDERADVFALGSILCEILTGQPTFAGKGGAELYRKAEMADLSDALARLDACGADAELVALARSCLAAAPKHRPRDAGIIVAGLTAYLRGVEGRLREAELAQARAETRAAGERRRRLLSLALAASVLATALIGAAGWGWMDRERRRREERAELGGGRGPRRRLQETRACPSRGRRPGPLGRSDRGRPPRRVAPRRWRSRAPNSESGFRRSWPTSFASETRPRPSRRTAASSSGLPPSTTISGVHNDEAKADAEYASAFRAYGVDLDKLDPKAAGRMLAGGSAAAELASALDRWAFLRRGRTLHDPQARSG